MSDIVRLYEWEVEEEEGRPQMMIRERKSTY